MDLILQKHEQHTKNHDASAASKAKAPALTPPEIVTGDLVYLVADSEKSRQREWYLVVTVDGEWCNVRKFTENQFRTLSYRVKKSQCFHVPVAPTSRSPVKPAHNDTTDDVSEFVTTALPCTKPHPQLSDVVLPIPTDAVVGVQQTYDDCRLSPDALPPTADPVITPVNYNADSWESDLPPPVIAPENYGADSV